MSNWTFLLTQYVQINGLHTTQYIALFKLIHLAKLPQQTQQEIPLRKIS